MDKKHIVRFLKEKKRGVYTLIVNSYPEVVSSMGTTMALALIKEDLEKVSGEEVEINYFSLKQAITKRKAPVVKLPPIEKTKWEFKDTNELKSDQSTPGKFKLD